MRLLHMVFAMMTMVSVALLPGPSHAFATLSHASVAPTHPQAHHQRDAMAGGHAGCPMGHGPTRPPSKTCSPACCAPAVADPASPVVTRDASPTIVRPARLTADVGRPDAARGPLLRPPTSI